MISLKNIEEKKILIIDDEQSILEMLETVFLKEGFKKIYTASTGLEGLTICNKINPDMIILDIMLPDIDGFEVCKKIRDLTLAPIMFISARNEDLDKLIGLTIGGDDYITKPFSPKEVAMKVKAYFRRIEYIKNSNEENEIIFGDIKINIDKSEVLKSNILVPLTAKEYQLLLYLAKYPNYIISKKNLYESVWNEPYLGYDNALMVHIRHLREKIESNPSKPQYLLTVKGLGYKLSIRK